MGTGCKKFKAPSEASSWKTEVSIEEFTIVLAQMEACLNSRPLWALSEDVQNLDVLTQLISFLEDVTPVLNKRRRMNLVRL